MSPADLSIAEAGTRLRDGSLTAPALAEAHLDRIRSRDGAVHALVGLDGEKVLAQARQADAELRTGHDRGALHGIPVGIKDLIDVAGEPTGCGSPAAGGRVAEADAAIVARLREAGAVVLGKLATYEFALVGPSFEGVAPPAANPWNPRHVTGGSSSGSAAAVGAGLVRTSIGTDTGGSVRSPAGYCGVVGLKPTYGRVPLDGVFPLSRSLDHAGPISASVAEAALTLDAIAPPALHPAAASRIGEGVEGLRIAYARGFFAGDPQADPAVVAAMDEAASQMSLLGCRIQETAMPDYALFEAVGAVILHREALDLHAARLRRAAQNAAQDYGRLAFQTLASGLCLSAADLAQARRAAGALRAMLDARVFGRFDALLTVNTLTTAPPFSRFSGEQAAWTPMRTIPFNVTGHPALALPAGFSDGLPIGMQLVGPWGGEAAICRIGHAFEQATDHAAQRPAFPDDRPAAGG